MPLDVNVIAVTCGSFSSAIFKQIGDARIQGGCELPESRQGHIDFSRLDILIVAVGKARFKIHVDLPKSRVTPGLPNILSNALEILF
jgi:hypothetical protein